jgi:hypothetical protein
MIRDPLTHFQPERPVLQDAARFFFGLLNDSQSAGSETHWKVTRPRLLSGFRLLIALQDMSIQLLFVTG